MDMSALPARMHNRWQERAEPGPGDAQLYWHILMRDQPQVCALAAVARRRLAGFPGLHFTPEQRLHLSVLRLGLVTELARNEIDAMTAQARHLLRQVPPATRTLGRVLYHPEAITLGVSPGDALDAVSLAIHKAAGILARPVDIGPESRIPHVTVAYSTHDQPAEPIIAALGHELPECPLIIDTIHLIAQYGAERSWNWQSIATIPIGP
jgi:hypothetical protein